LEISNFLTGDLVLFVSEWISVRMVEADADVSPLGATVSDFSATDWIPSMPLPTFHEPIKKVKQPTTVKITSNEK
jgi:hypothetical protein